MDDFNLLELLLSEPAKEAHALRDSDTEPYVEDYDTDTSMVGRALCSPFRCTSDSYTVY